MEFLRTIFKIFDNLELETEEKKPKKLTRTYIFVEKVPHIYCSIWIFYVKFSLKKKMSQKKSRCSLSFLMRGFLCRRPLYAIFWTGIWLVLIFGPKFPEIFGKKSCKASSNKFAVWLGYSLWR